MECTQQAGANSKSVRMNEDVARIIVEHLARDCFVIDPRLHWTSLVSVNKPFNSAVRHLLAKTSKIALEDVYGDVRVILTCEPTVNRCHALTSSISFEEKELAASFVRFVARNVSNWLTIDVEDYSEHSADDEILKALSYFPRINSIIFRRPQCCCPVCCELVDHAGPDVKIVERSEDGSESDGESLTSGHVSGGGDDSEEDDHDDLYIRDVDDY
ncbi:hypothetical protein Y032_0065g3662 [Ancylostoma ceylanicum]|uniref:Uncharacterized protein n=1 Tax=Ancylostoma ceylanicum TaxID=53326 RepID=A0A016U1B6_9BILA|nr:hypothetical protein Y032_0065g3662 [Ancylostoma ceylanicum]